MRNLLLALPLILAACDARYDAKSAPPTPPAPAAEKAKDVICQMMVDKATAIRHVHDHVAYYFCADECLKRFQADPKKHAAPCSCGKTSAKCPCEHCGHHQGKCDCGK
jgi:YHS domain-containing protein